MLAFGKQDLAGAQAAWKQVVELAPDSPEAQAAQRALEGVAAAGHGADAAGRHAGQLSRGAVVIRFLLLAVLFILVARAFWKLVGRRHRRGAGHASRHARARRRPSSWCAIRCAAPTCRRDAALSVTAAGTTHYFCSETSA